MEQEDNNRLTLAPLVILALLILWGCSKGSTNTAGLLEPAPTPATVLTPTPTVEDKQPPHPVKEVRGPCENYLLQAAAKEEVRDNQYKKDKNFEPTDNALPPDLKKWLQNMREDMLVVYELRNGDKKALILGSLNNGATGLASNFLSWRIQLDSYSVEFLSVSEDPKLIFWDKGGTLNYYSIEYSDEFIEKKDYDNITFDLLRYRVGPAGDSQLVSKEQNVKCE